MAVNRDLLTKFNLKVVKRESVILANELIATAQYDKSEAAKHEHGWLDDNGKNKWEKWTTYVQDKETTIWQAVLHVSTAANGERYLYDIDTIKKSGAVRNVGHIYRYTNISRQKNRFQAQFQRKVFCFCRCYNDVLQKEIKKDSE